MADQGNSSNFALSLSIVTESKGIEKLFSDIEKIKKSISEIKIPDGVGLQVDSLKNVVSSIANIKKKLQGFSSDEIKNISSQLTKEVYDLSRVVSSVSRSNKSVDLSEIVNSINSLKEFLAGKTNFQDQSPQVDASKLSASMDKLNDTISHAKSDFGNALKKQLLDVYLKTEKERELSGFQKLEFALTGNTSISDKFSSGEIGQFGVLRRIAGYLNEIISNRRDITYRKGYLIPGSEKTNDTGEKIEGTGDIVSLRNIKKSIINQLGKILSDYASSEEYKLREIVSAGNSAKKRVQARQTMSQSLGSAVADIGTITEKPMGKEIRAGQIYGAGRDFYGADSIAFRNNQIKADIVKKFSEKYIAIFKSFLSGPSAIGNYITSGADLHGITDDLLGMIKKVTGSGHLEDAKELNTLIKSLEANQKKFNELKKLRLDAVHAVSAAGFGGSAGELVNSYINRNGVGINTNEQKKFDQIKSIQEVAELSKQISEFKGTSEKVISSISNLNKLQSNNSFSSYYDAMINAMTGVINATDKMVNMLSDIRERIIAAKLQKDSPVVQDEKQQKLIKRRSNNILDSILKNDKKTVAINNAYHVGEKLDFDRVGHAYFSPNSKAPTFSQLEASNAFGKQDNIEATITRIVNKIAPVSRLNLSSIDPSSRDWYIEKAIGNIEKGIGEGVRVLRITRDGKNYSEQVVIGKLKNLTDDPQKIKTLEEVSSRVRYNGNVDKRYFTNLLEGVKRENPEFKQRFDGFRLRKGAEANFNTETNTATFRKGASIGTRVHEYSHAVNAKLGNLLSFEEMVADMTKISFGGKSNYSEILNEVAKSITFGKNPIENAKKLAEKMVQLSDMFEYINQEISAVKGKKYVKGNILNIAMSIDSLFHNMELAAGGDKKQIAGIRESKGKLLEKLLFSNYGGAKERSRRIAQYDNIVDKLVESGKFDISSYDDLRKISGIAIDSVFMSSRMRPSSDYRNNGIYEDKSEEVKERRKKHSAEKEKIKKQEEERMIQHGAEIFDINDVVWLENAFSPNYLMPQYDIMRKYRLAQKVRETGRPEGDFKTQAQANEFLDSLNRSGSVAYKVPVYKGSEIEIDDKGRITNQKMNGMYTRFFTTRSKLDEDYLVRGKKDIDDFTYFRRMLSAAMTYKPTEEMMKNLNAPSRKGAYAGMDENLAVIKSILNQSGYKFNRKEDFEQVVKKLFVGQGVNSENARKIGEIIADVLRAELRRSKTEQSIISPSSPDDIRKQKKQLERERVNAIKEDISSRAESKSMTAAGNVINKVAMYGTVTSVFYGVAHGIQNAINTMKNFETQLVETTKVLNPVYEGTTKISEAAQDFGVKYGTSIVNVAGAMSTFAQQGKSVSETINLTEASLLAANTTTLKAAEATEALTAAMKQFNIADKDAKSIIDSWLEVESRTAVTARTMALALRQTGTVARSAGVSFHELNGIISAVGSATRESGNAIGTALKYIFSHMNTDDVIEKFSQLGIAVYDSDGKMRGLMDRLSSLNEKWKGMTSEQRTATAIAIAGTRRYNSLMILMDKWGDVIDATKMSEDSYGRAMTANTRVMGTYAKQIEKTKATMENFFATTFESGGKGLLNYFESLKQTIASIGAVMPDSLATMIGSASVLGLGSMMISRTFAYSGIGNYLQGIDRRKSDEKAFNRQYREIMSPVYGGRSETLGSFFNLFNPRRLTEERIKRAEANLREFRLERVDDPLHPGAKKFDFAKGTKGEEWANKQRARGIAEERLITLTQQHNLERQRELDILKKSTGSLRGFNGRLDVLGMHIQKHAAVIGMLGIGMMSIANSKLFEDKYSSTGKNIAGQSMDFAGAILSGAAAGSMFGPKGAIAGAALAGVTKTIEYAPKWYEDLFGSTEKENARLLKESNRIKNLDSGIKEYRRLLERRNRGELLSPEEETRFRETQNIVMMTDPNSVEIDRLTGRARLSDEYARNYKYSSGSDRRRLFNQMAYNTMFGGGGIFGNSSQDVFDSVIRKQAQIVQKALYNVNNSTGTAQERNKDVYRKELEQLDTLQKQREKSFEPFIMSYGNMAKDITNYVRQGGSGESPFSNFGKEYSGKMYEQFVKVFGEREAREKILSSYIGGRTAGRTYDWSPDLKNRAYATGKITELIRVKNNEDGSSVYQLVETDFATQQQRVVKTFTVKRGTTSFAAIQEAIKGTDLKSSEVFHIDSATQEYFDLPLKTIDKFIDTLNKISDSTQKRLQRSLRYAEEDYRLVNSSTIFDPSALSKITAFRKSVASRKGLFGDISSYVEEMNRIESLPEGNKRVTSRTTLQAQISAGELAGTASAAFLTSINKIATYSEKLNTISKLVSMDFGSSNKGGTNLEADASTSQNYAIKQINEFLKTKGMNTTFEQMVADGGGGEKGREKARQLVLNMMAQDANEGVEDAFKALEDTANAVFEFYGKLRENSENTEKAIKDRTSVIMALNKNMSFYDAEAIARKELEGNFNVPEQFGQEIKQLSSFIDLLEQQLKTNKQNVQGSEQELEKLKTQLKEAESVGDKNSADKFRQQIQGITDALAKQRQNNVTIENRIASLRKGRDAREQAIFGEEVRKGLFSDAVSLRKFRDQLQIRRASEGINATENMWGGSQRLRIEQAQEEMDRITNLSVGRLKEQGYNFGSYEDIQNRFKELQEKEQQGILSDAEKKEYAQIREVINAFSKDFNNAATTIANNQKSIEIAVGKQGKQIRSNYANFEFYALTGHRGTAQAQATLTKSLYDNITRAGVEFFRSGKEKLSANDRDKAVGMFQDLNNLQDMIDRESNLSYRKNYLLASNQERAMIDMIDARRQMGESMEGIFADPFMKEYAKKHSAVGQAIDYGLQKEPSLRMLDLQGAQTDVIKRLFNFMTSKASEGGFKVTFNDGQLSNLINAVIRESKSLNDEAKNTVSGSIGTTGAAGRRRGAAGGFVGYTGNGGKYEPKGVLDNIVYHSDEIISILKSGGNKEDRDYIARLSMDYNSGKRLKHAANGIVISNGAGSSPSGSNSSVNSNKPQKVSVYEISDPAARKILKKNSSPQERAMFDERNLLVRSLKDIKDQNIRKATEAKISNIEKTLRRAGYSDRYLSTTMAKFTDVDARRTIANNRHNQPRRQWHRARILNDTALSVYNAVQGARNIYEGNYVEGGIQFASSVAPLASKIPISKNFISKHPKISKATRFGLKGLKAAPYIVAAAPDLIDMWSNVNRHGMFSQQANESAIRGVTNITQTLLPGMGTAFIASDLAGSGIEYVGRKTGLSGVEEFGGRMQNGARLFPGIIHTATTESGRRRFGQGGYLAIYGDSDISANLDNASVRNTDTKAGYRQTRQKDRDAIDAYKNGDVRRLIKIYNSGAGANNESNRRAANVLTLRDIMANLGNTGAYKSPIDRNSELVRGAVIDVANERHATSGFFDRWFNPKISRERITSLRRDVERSHRALRGHYASTKGITNNSIYDLLKDKGLDSLEFERNIGNTRVYGDDGTVKEEHAGLVASALQKTFEDKARSDFENKGIRDAQNNAKIEYDARKKALDGLLAKQKKGKLTKREAQRLPLVRRKFEEAARNLEASKNFIDTIDNDILEDSKNGQKNLDAQYAKRMKELEAQLKKAKEDNLGDDEEKRIENEIAKTKKIYNQRTKSNNQREGAILALRKQLGQDYTKLGKTRREALIRDYIQNYGRRDTSSLSLNGVKYKRVGDRYYTPEGYNNALRTFSDNFDDGYTEVVDADGKVTYKKGDQTLTKEQYDDLVKNSFINAELNKQAKNKKKKQQDSRGGSTSSSGSKSKGARDKAKADSSGETFELWGSVDGSLGKVVSKTKTLTKEQADRYLQDKDRFTVVTVNGKKIVTRKSNQAAVEALHKNKDVGKAVRDQFTAIGKTAEAKNKATQDFLKSEDGEFLDSAIDEMSADELAKKGFSKKNLDERRNKILEQRRMKALEAKAKELKMSVPELERKIKRGEIADVEYNEEISNSELLSEAERFHLASDEGVRNKAKKQHAESAKQQAQQQAEFDAMEAESQEIENADIERQTSLFNRQYRNADGSLINPARVREIQTGRVKPQNKAEEDIAREAVSEYGYVHKPGGDNYLRKYAVQGGYIEPETDEDKEWLAEKQEEYSRKAEAERTRKQNTPEGNTSYTANNNSSTDDSKLLDGIEKIDPNSGMAMIRTVLTGQILPVLQQTLNAAQNNEGQQREQRSVFGTKIPDGNQ